LPDEQVKLYDEAVKVLRNRWQKSKGLAPSPVLAAFLRDDRRVRPTLERLAYEAHRQKGKEAADLPRTPLLDLLDESFDGDLTLTGEFIGAKCQPLSSLGWRRAANGKESVLHGPRR
jgi:hypothetical protein